MYGFQVTASIIDEGMNMRSIRLFSESQKLSSLIHIEPRQTESAKRYSESFIKELQLRHKKNIKGIKREFIGPIFAVWYSLVEEGEAFENCIAFLLTEVHQITVSCSALANNKEAHGLLRDFVSSLECIDMPALPNSDLLHFVSFFASNQQFYLALSYLEKVDFYSKLDESFNKEDLTRLFLITSEVHESLGAFDLALKYLLQGLGYQPNNPLLLYQVAAFYARSGIFNDVMEYLELAFYYGKESNMPSILMDPRNNPSFQFFLLDPNNMRTLEKMLENYIIQF